MRRLPAFALVVLLVLPVTFALGQARARKPGAGGKPAAGKLDAAKENPREGADELESLVNKGFQGHLFRLVNVAEPEQGLEGRLYWRTLLGKVAAEVSPRDFQLDGEDVIAPQVKSDEEDPEISPVPPTTGRFKLEDGKHVLTPGAIPIVVKAGVPSSTHPAIQVKATKAGQEVRILCAQVKFEVVDSRGVPASTDIRIAHGERSLFRKPAVFNVLRMWLPVGVEYSTSFGTFQLDAAGNIKNQRLVNGVEVAEGTLRKTVPGSGAGAAAAPASLAVRFLGGSAETPENQRPTFLAFVPPLVKPGTPLQMAVSRKAYREATGKDLDAGEFSVRVNYRSQAIQDVQRAPFTLLERAPAELTSKAESSLRTKGADVAWLEGALPQNLSGPTQLILENKHVSPASTSVLIAELGEGLELVPYRWRTDFAGEETAVYEVLVANGQPAAQGRIMIQTAGGKEKPVAIGKLPLPSVAGKGSDSRLFTLAMRDLPSGKYALWVETDAARSGKVPVNVVSWTRKSPFLGQSMSCCIACWPTSEEGLSLLHDAGLEMAASTGASSSLGVEMPQVDRTLLSRLEQFSIAVPGDALLQPTGNDYLLSRMLRHQLRHIDLTVVRAHGMYNEGLSYHHSYQPSVDRMVRRMQVFTQQTGEYPSFWGVNYAWFPNMYGYVEGGVPTDPHTADRNRTLVENLKADGIEALSQEDRAWYDKHKFSTVAAERERALALQRQAVKYWKASQEAGWGKHNRLYNEAVRQVRPDTVCTLFDNAGHDEWKRTRSLFGDMNAVCYESYTDFGDWPMSAGFATDWARANAPGKPVWLTTCWGTSAEGKAKSLFHAVGRGLAGGGPPMESTTDLGELARRGMGLRFVSQYGGVSEHAVPDRRVAILSRAATLALTPRGMWEYHALYYHLTRLGYPPVLLADDEFLADGAPAGTELLVLADEQQPLEPEAAKAIAAFVAKGGKVLVAGESPLEVAGAIRVKQPLKHLWDLKGFEGAVHQQMWDEFDNTWRKPLAEALQQAGIESRVTTDVEKAYAISADAGDVRYVTAIADVHRAHSNQFERTKQLPVSLAGTGWIVRDLARQQTLETKTVDGRTELTVDLVTEPVTVLALLKSAPASVNIQLTGTPSLGGELSLKCSVTAENKQDLGPLPVTFTVTAPDGTAQGSWHRAAGDVLQVPLALRDESGAWQVTAQELTTGLSGTVEVRVEKPAAPQETAAAVGAVHVVDRGQTRAFTAREGEKLIVVEPEQRELLPVARKLAEDLAAAGVSARVWEVKIEEFDTIPVRWYPRDEDTARLAEINAGKLIGYRENLRAYIDKTKRAHVPELGGYGEIEPAYMVGQDCIVFSGGRLAESLRAVTGWMNTPTVPGRGQGRLVVCFSPFLANRQALAVVGNDLPGLELAAKELAALARQPKEAVPPQKKPAASKWDAPVAKSERKEVSRPLSDYSPIERSERLLATRDGRSVLLLTGEADNAALIDAEGKVSATVTLGESLRKYTRIDSQGRLVTLSTKALALHPGWHFPTEIELRQQCIGTDGKVAFDVPVFRAQTAGLPPDYEGGFLLGADDRPALFARTNGLAFRTPRADTWSLHDGLLTAQRRFEVLFPRMPVGLALSPDGRFAFFTTDCRPPFGAFSNPPTNPTSVEAVLLDLESGERVWSLADEEFRKPSYAVSTGFSQVGKDGSVTAFADYNGVVRVVDRQGEELVRQQVGPIEEHATAALRIGPLEGVGVWLSDDGETAAFGFRNALAVVKGKNLVQVPVSGLVSACVSHDGSLVVAAMQNGRVEAFDAEGAPLWQFTPGGTHPLVAASGDHDVLVATATAAVVKLDNAGKEVWRTDVAEVADRDEHVPAPMKKSEPISLPLDYQEPQTLEYAKEHLSAELLAEWEPAGEGTSLYGRAFHTVKKRLELNGEGEPSDAFVHLVYRRPADNTALSLTVAGRDGKQTFVLDLPTPEYRVVDLPLRGPKAEVQLDTTGPVEIAEFSLWKFDWPGSNMAYVKPAAENLGDKEVASADKEEKPAAEGDLLDDLVEKKKESTGKLKECRIYWPNSDPDQVAGPYFRAPVDPTQIVDSKRFGVPALAPFAGQKGNYGPTRGGFFTVDFGNAQPLALIATYDRASKQSELAVNLAVFATASKEPQDSLITGSVLSGATQNDQFWRLFPIEETEVHVLGVHVFKTSTDPVGLSEVEAYAP